VTNAVTPRARVRSRAAAGRKSHDLLAFGLRDAPGDGDRDAAAGACGAFFEHADAAELGIDLLGRLLADVAGVEDDEVGVIGGCRLDVALARQDVRHALGVIDVHLAAVGLDKGAAGGGGLVLSQCRRGSRPERFGPWGAGSIDVFEHSDVFGPDALCDRGPLRSPV
jgi:hypothetical protein